MFALAADAAFYGGGSDVVDLFFIVAPITPIVLVVLFSLAIISLGKKKEVFLKGRKENYFRSMWV